MKTQLQRALNTLPSATEIEKIRATHCALRNVLDEAQNEPPEGVADGSIQGGTWSLLRYIERRLGALLGSTDVYVANGGPLGPGAATPLREQVLEFHRAFDHPSRETPGSISEERVRFRARLITEEFFEVLEACFTDEVVCDGRLGHDLSTGTCPSCGNTHHVLGLNSLRQGVLDLVARSGVRVSLPELVDGLADLDYVVEGTRLEFGVDGAPIAAEVHRTNMTKHGGGKRADGKTQKPDGWRPPDIEGELMKQGWKP